MIGIISTGVQTMVGGIVLLAFGGLGLRYALTWRAKAARRGLTPSEPSGLARRWD